MGGQHGYFGLWLDSDFGRGHSRARPKCTTYGSPQLSGEEDFTVDSMEVWAVGKPPEPEEVRDNSIAQNSVSAWQTVSSFIQTGYTFTYSLVFFNQYLYFFYFIVPFCIIKINK